MTYLETSIVSLTVIGLLVAPAQAKRCPADSVKVGVVCVDRYEASVWEIPASETALIKKVQKGKAGAAADLSGVIQRGATSDDYGAGCSDNGNGCKDFYAVSIPGVLPSRSLTWFQAAACRNAGKRLVPNSEWQAAALGTPDPGTDDGASDCNVSTSTGLLPEDPVVTGSRTGCVSDAGVADMVGNVMEWVADWGDASTGCTNWGLAFGGDESCVGGNGSINLPGAFLRGGEFNDDAIAGVFSINNVTPDFTADTVGFRCAR